VRRGTLKATRRTESSIAVSANGEDWLLINSSPDLLAQIAGWFICRPTLDFNVICDGRLVLA
jgi:phosphoribosyl 1,2-cyclic phosphodiesterase